MPKPEWNGQNIPVIRKECGRRNYTILPVLQFLLDYDDDTIFSILPSGGNIVHPDQSDEMYYAFHYDLLIPDDARYGGLPAWFPKTDKDDRQLSPQGQVDRFLYLLDQAYGGLGSNHRNACREYVVEAIFELHDHWYQYQQIEEDEEMEWELDCGISTEK